MIYSVDIHRDAGSGSVWVTWISQVTQGINQPSASVELPPLGGSFDSQVKFICRVGRHVCVAACLCVVCQKTGCRQNDQRHHYDDEKKRCACAQDVTSLPPPHCLGLVVSTAAPCLIRLHNRETRLKQRHLCPTVHNDRLDRQIDK